MKKILLSLAVIVASGAYVVVENQFGSQQPDGAAAAALSIDPSSTLQPQAGSIDLGSLTSGAPTGPATSPTIVLGAAPAAAKTSTSLSAMAAAAPVPVMPAASKAATDVADLAPTQPPAIAATIAPAARALPSLPRSRPIPVAQPAAVAQAAPAPAAQSQGQFVDGTYKGTSANAYYGRVQVEAVVQGGQLASINVLSYPNDRRTSRYINGQALPMLTREAIRAQSANVDAVSGATLTSNAYRQSLAAALRAAGGAATAAGGNNA